MRSLVSPLVAAIVAASPTVALSQSTGTVRNIILVHGAFADGSSYAKVIPLLTRQGYNVIAVQNPLSSLSDDVAATKRAIGQLNAPVILVGHSWGGMSITEAGNDPRVAGLVYICALVPDSGQTANDVTKAYPPTPGLKEAKPDADGYLWMTRQGMDLDFVPDLPQAERAIVFATQGPWNSKALSDQAMTPAWKTKPSWFVVGANDRMLPPDYERAIAKHIGATTKVLTSGHVPMLSQPQAVAAVIMDAAKNAKRTAAGTVVR